MLPKKKSKILADIDPPRPGREFLKFGFDRIEELMRKTDSKTNFLPRTITIKDIDREVKDYVDSGNLELNIDGKKVPVFYLENDRWGEFSKTWKYMDGDKNVPTPYITVRRSDKQPGTRLGVRYRIPQPRNFRYLDVPVLDEGQIINLRFKIPQPTNVDLTYDVRLFTKYRVDVNQMDELVLRHFASRQEYIFVNCNNDEKFNPMPLLLESMSEANTIENIDGDRFYVSIYTLKALGFIQDEEEFEITKTSRAPRLGFDLS